MKVCRYGLENIWVDYANGEMRMCGWTHYRVGSLLESTIEELWHGEKAERFRESLKDGSYCFCDKGGCPYWGNNQIEEVSVEYHVPEYPKFCSLSYEEQCNYVCKFCRKERYMPDSNEKEGFLKIEKEIKKFIGQLNEVSANGIGELFCSPSALRLLGELKDKKNLKVSLESNGSLFNKKNWEKISNLGNFNLSVYITVHSFDEDTYQFLSGTKLPIQNVIDNLYFIKSLREKEIINRLEIATVVCERNFRQIPEYIQYCLNEFNPDSIRLRFFMPYGVHDLSTEWFYDIRNPYHPYYEEFVKVMQHPILKHPKVWKWQGENLSNFKQHPYILEHGNYMVLQKLVKIDRIKEKLLKYFEKKNIKTFALYCNGYLGQSVASILDKEGIVFGHIFDSNVKATGDYCGHPVSKPEEELLKIYDAIIITSTLHYTEIENTLKSYNYNNLLLRIAEVVECLETE